MAKIEVIHKIVGKLTMYPVVRVACKVKNISFASGSWKLVTCPKCLERRK